MGTELSELKTLSDGKQHNEEQIERRKQMRGKQRVMIVY